MKLKETRARKLLTVRGLAEKAGVSPSTVQNVEQGIYRPSLAVVRKLSEALATDPDEVDEFRASVEAVAQGRWRRKPEPEPAAAEKAS